MDPKEHIERAVEHRRAQAAERNLTRKLNLIVTTLGQEIRRQGGGVGVSGFAFEQQQTLDPDWSWQLDSEDDGQLPVSDEGSSFMGWQFDGLSSGVNLQICYDKTTENLKASYDGYLVYEEMCNTVVRYLPSPQWEDKLDLLCRIAERKAKLKEQDHSDDKKKGRSRLQKVRDYLRSNWGI